MKKLSWSVLLVIMVVGLLAGCSGGVRTYSDSGQTISIGVNQEFVIALGSNPTTGYSWQESFDETILQLVAKKYEPGEQAKEVVGAGGVEFFTFKATQTGETKITLNYQRSWEEQSVEQKIFVIDIK